MIWHWNQLTYYQLYWMYSKVNSYSIFLIHKYTCTEILTSTIERRLLAVSEVTFCSRADLVMLEKMYVCMYATYRYAHRYVYIYVCILYIRTYYVSVNIFHKFMGCSYIRNICTYNITS